MIPAQNWNEISEEIVNEHISRAMRHKEKHAFKKSVIELRIIKSYLVEEQAKHLNNEESNKLLVPLLFKVMTEIGIVKEKMGDYEDGEKIMRECLDLSDRYPGCISEKEKDRAMET